jgi:DNA-binding transcriptional LysR family regulator
MSPGNTALFAGIPLHTLRVFDAAARHRNMVKAAAELGTTQSAVSRQLKALEESLGTLLFRRGPRGVSLTEAGDLLADYVSRAFEELATGLHRIGQPRRRTTLVVTAPRSFAIRVLSPRIAAFVRLYPRIDLRVDTHRYYDAGHSGSDISIRAGDGNWADCTVERLTEDSLFPVCAPALWLAESQALAPADYLRQHVLLHYAERPYWSAWLRGAGLDPTIGEVGPRFSESAITLAAAEAGQGVAIGRTSLVADALRTHRLVRPFEGSVDDGVRYFLVVRETMRKNPLVNAFADWLIESLRPANGLLKAPE